MNTSFKANAAQHKAFIATVKSQFPAINLTGLSLELHCSDYKYDWTINDVITFFTETGKYFVVKASDLLVSVDEATLIQAPARNSIDSLNDNSSNTGWTWSNDDNCFFPDEPLGNEMQIIDSSDNTDNSLDDDSDLYWDIESSLEEDTDDDIRQLAAPSKTDMFAIMQSVYERDLQAAKILFHYWALSGNSYPVPNKWNNLRDFVISNNGSIDIGSTLCPARKEYFRTKDLNINGKIFFLWELRELEESIGDDAAIDYSEDGFFQLLNNMVAEKYGVYSWFTQKDISVYQQNYQAIVADCEQIIHFHDELNFLADCGEREYMPFPTNINELHDVVKATYGIAEADSVVNSIKDEEYLFFQVLSTMNFINSTASTVEA